MLQQLGVMTSPAAHLLPRSPSPRTPKSTALHQFQQGDKTYPSPGIELAKTTAARAPSGSIGPNPIPSPLFPNQNPSVHATATPPTQDGLLAGATSSASPVAPISSSSSDSPAPLSLSKSPTFRRRKKDMTRIRREIKVLEEISSRLTYLYPKRDKLKKKLCRRD
ncbi:hypothetical protein BDZ97DRAFT_1916031 [Flammula alnicola]|nr:hypothetical protein BDZ97DRAFT_1916031 [Flammula alnicola]